MKPKITIIDGNNEIELSTVEENIKAYMVKGEKGADGTSPTASVSKTGSTSKLIVTDANGTTQVNVLDGYNPTITTSRTGHTTTITTTDINGTTDTEIYDGIDLTGGVPTNGVIGWDDDNIFYSCDGTETGIYYLTYNTVSYYFTMPTVAEGDILLFNTTDLELSLNGTTISTSSSGTGTQLTFDEYIPNGYELTDETFGGDGESIIALKTITTAPLTFSQGDKYYNSTDDLIYTATSSSTWNNGETPSTITFYLNETDNKLYRYYNNQMNLEGFSGEVVDSLSGSSTTDAPSVHAVNTALDEVNTNISNLIKTQSFSRNNITQPTGFDFWALNPALSIPTGYSLIGFVVTQQPDNEKCLVSIDAGSGNNVYAKIYNGGSSSVSGNVSGKAIFIKNS